MDFNQAVFEAIEAQTPENSIQREYAEAIAAEGNHSPFRHKTPYHYAAERQLEPAEDNVQFVASGIVTEQLEWFKDLNSGDHDGRKTTAADELSQYDVEYNDETPVIGYGN